MAVTPSPRAAWPVTGSPEPSDARRWGLSVPPQAEYLAAHGNSLWVLLDRSLFLLRDAFLEKLFGSYFVPVLIRPSRIGKVETLI